MHLYVCVYITPVGDSLIPFINSYTSNHVPTKQLCLMQRHNLKIIETGNGKMLHCHCILIKLLHRCSNTNHTQ